MTAGRMPGWEVALLALAVLSEAFTGTLPAFAAGPSARDIAVLLYKAAPGTHPAMSGRDLRRLDLANLDFKKADLSKTNLFGADLSGANLSGVDLRDAMLDRVTLIGAKLDFANLDHASMMRPSTFTDLRFVRAEAPSFKSATLRGVKFFGSFAGSNFAGADLTDSVCAPVNKTGFIEYIWRTDFTSANLTGANLTRADMTQSRLSFAVLKNAIMRDVVLQQADLSGADLSGADLSGADLRGADLTDANVTGANLDGVMLHDAKGLESLKGLTEAHNSEKIIR